MDAIWHTPGRVASTGAAADEAILKKLVERPPSWTGSTNAPRRHLDNWAESRAKFVKVFPNEYKPVPWPS